MPLKKYCTRLDFSTSGSAIITPEVETQTLILTVEEMAALWRAINPQTNGEPKLWGG
jgi:hypothetical protein